MPQEKTIVLAGRAVDVIEVEIRRRRKEEPNEYELEDGSIIRISSPAMVVYRVAGSTDNEGNPTYLVKTGISTVVVHPPNPRSTEPA